MKGVEILFSEEYSNSKSSFAHLVKGQAELQQKVGL